MPGRKDLIFCRLGNHSLHQEWLQPAKDRTFDLFLDYYGDIPGRHSKDGEYYTRCKESTRYNRLFELIRSKQLPLHQYESVWIAADDISTNATTIQHMFRIFREQKLWLAQPALTENSCISHSITKVNPQYRLRYTNTVEGMVPLFSREALLRCMETFPKTVSGWGLAFVWPKLLGNPKDKIAIIDETPVRHTRKVGVGDLYRNLKVRPEEELRRITKEYGVVPYQFHTFGSIART